jgi:hypothetical protein
MGPVLDPVERLKTIHNKLNFMGKYLSKKFFTIKWILKFMSECFLIRDPHIFRGWNDYYLD